MVNCSSMSWKNEAGDCFLARTYDQFGDLSANGIAVVPAGYALSLSLDGKRSVTTKYGYTGMAIKGFASPIQVDGVNEKGLTGALLNYPKSGHFNTNIGGVDMHPAFFLGYVLGLCGSVEEAAKLIKDVNLTDELIMGALMSTHYIFSDSTGEAMIVEPDANGISIHRNTIGVMCNSPDYLWHKTNLRNYISVDPEDLPPKNILGENFAPFGNGTAGSHGLPGGYSSPSRFINLAYTKQHAPKGKDELDSVSRIFRAFSVVTIPEGILKAGEGYEITLCTSVMSSASLTYYFSPYTDRRVHAVRLTEALKDGVLKYFDIPASEDIDYFA